MKNKTFRKPDIVDELHTLHAERQEVIRARLEEFSRVPPSEYFYELAYCLLTPQSSAMNCDRVVRFLRDCDFYRAEIDPEPLLHQGPVYVRFHKTKAQRLIELKKLFPLVLAALANSYDSRALREWLVLNVKGLGYKESTHFLRNIGHRGLAILDRHILRNLKRYGVIRRIPHTLSRRQYNQIERKFMNFADAVGIPMDELDLLIWSMETGEVFK
ncbi:MAG: N-glycosylase/DNA lyase [Bacteroidota bacterium]